MRERSRFCTAAVLALPASVAPGRPRPGLSTRAVPPLDACDLVPGGVYALGDSGERVVSLSGVLIGRWPVVVAHVRRFVEATGLPVGRGLRRQFEFEQLADHPATGITFADVMAFCEWAGRALGRPVRLPTGEEWEAAARGTDRRQWPWGDVFDADRCNSVESAWGWTVPVRAHPAGAGPFGTEQLAGNVWEWVDCPPDDDGWRIVRGGSYLDTAWGVRAARELPADPDRATPTTGFRIAIDCCAVKADGGDRAK